MVLISNFINRWKASGASERANYQLFLSELCDVLGVAHPEPASDTTARNAYTFERAVFFDEGEGKTSTGFIDLYKRSCFVLEAKQGSDRPEATEAQSLGMAAPKRKMGTARRNSRSWERAMERAKNQALRYARSLPTQEGWPPLLVVTDVGFCFDLYADFSGQGKNYVPFPDAQSYRLYLDDLTDDEAQERLWQAWTDPMELDPSRRSAQVTRDLAVKLARLAASLEREGHAPDHVAHFLMRCLFTMFAEDVGLLPERSFTSMLADYRDELPLLPRALQALWQTMDRGGFLPGMKAEVPQFNGHLFAESKGLPLSEAQLTLLIEAAQADWTDVEPAIFGTLLERALDPVERHNLGAHFTPRAYVERLVMPTVIEPLRAEWTAVQAAALLREEEGDEQAARQEVVDFHRRLCSLRVLDPACGSGNFLYVSLEHMKRLEAEVLAVLDSYGGQTILDMTGGYTVSPEQFLGLEINPRAAAIAEVVLWIGYLQWHFQTYGSAQRLDPPILRAYNNIRLQDAVLTYDKREPRLDDTGEPVTRWDGRTTKTHPATGEQVPDETARTPIYDYPDARQADWPEVDFIIGNPPFLGPARMREALGDGYTEALRKAYTKDVPNSVDLVMYWWHKAAERIRTGQAERFGLITTNSLPQKFNRRVVQAQMDAKEPLSLVYAIPDHPWVDDGADVRISMTVGEAGTHEGRLLTVTEEVQTDEIGRDVMLEEQIGTIQADLTVGADVAGAVALEANKRISYRGACLIGQGFVVSPNEAEELGLGRVQALNQFIKPYLTGRDIVQKPRNRLVIDLFGLTAKEVRNRYPKVYQWVFERVKPERDQNRRKSRRENWWIFGEPISTVRPALEELGRFIISARTSKFRTFTFVPANTMVESEVIIIALNDAYNLGILSSRFHIVWALAAGGKLGIGNDPRYNNTRCFEPYPFPAATDAQQEQIRALAESLDAHRKARLSEYDRLTMTDLYNVLEQLRAGEPLSEKERAIHEQGLVSILKELHDELDAAVAAAYGWPDDLPAAKILERLVALNAERAEEEARGIIRYLRPAYQNPEGVQQALDVGADQKKQTGKKATKQPWPKELAAQAQAVKRALAAADRPATPKEIAQQFKRARLQQVESLLATLEALGLVRLTDDARYVA